MSTLHCPECGYNLTGLPENRCPECGKDFDPEQLEEQQNREFSGGDSTLLAVFLAPCLSIFGAFFSLTLLAIFDELMFKCFSYSYYETIFASPLVYIFEFLVLSAVTPVLLGITLGKRFRLRRLKDDSGRVPMPLWGFILTHILIQYVAMWICFSVCLLPFIVF